MGVCLVGSGIHIIGSNEFKRTTSIRSERVKCVAWSICFLLIDTLCAVSAVFQSFDPISSRAFKWRTDISLKNSSDRCNSSSARTIAQPAEAPSSSLRFR